MGLEHRIKSEELKFRRRAKRKFWDLKIIQGFTGTITAVAVGPIVYAYTDSKTFLFAL